MPKFNVTVIYDRLVKESNGVKRIDSKQVREGTEEAATGEKAKVAYLKKFKENEPHRRKIHSVTVKKLAS